MATYLELCQDVAQESGTFSNVGDPATLTGQTGRTLRLIKWVKDAYLDIQREEDAWRWLEAEFSASLTSGVSAYSSGDLALTTRFGDWIYRQDDDERSPFTVYKTADGQASETDMFFVEWREFRRVYKTGGAINSTGKPFYFSVSPDNKINVFPTPDDAYTLRGLYRKGPQTLAVDADVPEMPDRFHKAIQWRALVLLANFDEAFEQIPGFEASYDKVMTSLREDQLPRVKLCGPLA